MLKRKWGDGLLSKTDILGSVYDKLKELYPYQVYLDDVKRDFDVPCFFLKLITLRGAEKDYRFKNDCTLYISYIPEENDDAEETLRVRDAIDYAFWRGFKVKDRFIHMTSISHQTIGDDSDIAEISLTFSFYDACTRDEDVMIEHVYDDIKIKKG